MTTMSQAAVGRRARGGRLPLAMMALLALTLSALDALPSTAESDSGKGLGESRSAPAESQQAVSPTFADVPLDHPYYAHIEALYQAGYTAGCATDPLRYCPEQTMNRAESAVFVERGIHSTSYAPPTPAFQVFADLPLDSWAAGWVDSLWQDQYTAGCGTNPLVFCPWQGHTRAEGCVFYLRMLHGSGFEPPQPTQQTFVDVPMDAWYARWVKAAFDADLLMPCQTSPDIRFCPNDPLTRALAAYMMVQAKGLLPPPVPVCAEWTQHAHDAQRTGWTTQTVPLPWKFKWAKTGVAARSDSQMYPVTGGGRVYVVTATDQLVAIDLSSGATTWSVSPGGTLNSTPVYDSELAAVFVTGGSNLYRIDAATGVTERTSSANATLSTSPLLVDRVVYVTATNGSLFSVDKVDFTQNWVYRPAVTVNQVSMPSYSESRDSIIYGADQTSGDLRLLVFSVNTDGSLKWMVEPNPAVKYRCWTGPDSWQGTQCQEFKNNWPVIADNAGVVLFAMRMGYDANLAPMSAEDFASPAGVKAFFSQNPQYMYIHALQLDTGQRAFIPAVRYGAFGNGHLGIGPQPAVRTLPSGKQVAYLPILNSLVSPDYRESATIGEMVLDDTTVSGLTAGDYRLIDWWQPGIQGDELGMMSGSGDILFHSHWDWSLEGFQVTNRSDSNSGLYQILGDFTPWVAGAQSGCTCSPGGSTRYCLESCVENGGRRFSTNNGGRTELRGGFDAGDRGWNLNPYVVVSDNYVITKSIGGAIFVLQNGSPD